MQGMLDAENVRTRVGVRRQSSRMAGRTPSFSKAEIEVLRTVARRERSRRDWSGTQLGEAIGIAQQNAGRFVAAGSATGIDRKTANMLASLAGYRDVEHLLLEAGVLAEMEQPPGGSPWHDRDAAASISLRLGYSKAAIDAVVHRHQEREFTAKPLRWWVDRIVIENLALADEPRAEPAQQVSVPAKKKKKVASGG